MIVKMMNRLKKAEVPAAPEAPKLSKEAELLTDIRELLKKK
jgi:large-conductance mechanosensitive channel